MRTEPTQVRIGPTAQMVPVLPPMTGVVRRRSYSQRVPSRPAPRQLSPSSRRVLAVLALVLLAVGLFAGVRSVLDLPQRRAEGAVRNAPDEAYDSGSFNATVSVTYTAPGDAPRTTRATAAVNEESGRAHLELFPVLADDPLDIVSEGRDLYLSIPILRQQEFGGARWVRVEVESDTAARGAGVGPIPDPLTFLDALEGVVRPVEKGKTEKIGEVKAQRYDAEITYRRVAQRLEPAQARVIGGFGLTRIPVSVWIDDDGRPVRARFDFDLKEKGTVEVMLDVTDFGHGILIGIPPRAATLTVGSVEEALRAVSPPPPAEPGA